MPGSLNCGSRVGVSSCNSEIKITWVGLSAWLFEPLPLARLQAGTTTRIGLGLSRKCAYGRHLPVYVLRLGQVFLMTEVEKVYKVLRRLRASNSAVGGCILLNFELIPDFRVVRVIFKN